MRKILGFLFLLFFSFVSASEESSEEFRILDLIPGLITPLGVSPAIPANYVALAPSKQNDAYEWIYWGPKEDLEAYFLDKSSLKVPLIRVKLSTSITQKMLTSDKVFDEYKKILTKKIHTRHLNWGDNPVSAVEVDLANGAVHNAWVGLNADGDWTLIFNLVLPEDVTKKEEAKTFWNHFLEKTQRLSDHAYFKMHGQDLQDGYTIVLRERTPYLKVIAEKRKSDGILQVTGVPLNENVSFVFRDMQQCFMGSAWKHEEPLLKIRSTITFKDGNSELIKDCTLSVLIREVEEFSQVDQPKAVSRQI